ncbi:hypothetical protein FS764_07790 [Agrobacterium vitis]|uniref:hypothetical protein n=1 Tax=Agrobacterium vitis TaxID=373 RepID=UPI001F44D0F6|nr:hypothetical protein [Agrobacterium vitis]MCF1466815.1 hypothetical protein [Agrobacterium vitis]
MAKNFNSRLEKLKSRRVGPSDFNKITGTYDSFSAPIVEEYQKRSSKTASTYTLGAMQEVDPAYTRKSYEEAERVKNQLEKSISGKIQIGFDYQGSVPLNIHIKGVSDIDLLLLLTVYLKIDRNGPRANTSDYLEWNGSSGNVLLSELRLQAEEALKNAFPEANVDTSGSKAITISGGSLRREVDVIPSHWYDGIEYQRSREKKDRGIFIFLKKENDTMLNYPFLHMHHIQTKDDRTGGNTKKVIRLLKTLVADYEDGPAIELSSYDIAGLAWHFDNTQLSVARWNELSLLWSVKVNVDRIVSNESFAKALDTPDKTRKILDKPIKFNGLKTLQREIDDLFIEVASELSDLPLHQVPDISKIIRDSVIPAFG